MLFFVSGRRKGTQKRGRNPEGEEVPYTIALDNFFDGLDVILPTIQIHWGSEIRIRLDFEWSKRAWLANGQDFE